ncbi:MAG: hypothetical protein R3C53_20435 [Pirellulaceae bacterium]
MHGWTAFWEVVSSPGRLIFGGWEFMLAWLWTRPWGLLVAILLLPLSGLSFMLIASQATWFRSQEAALTQYWNLIDAELANHPATQSDEPALVLEAPVTPYADLLLERVLRLDRSNTRANYLVATQLAKIGRVGQARFMLRQIAGESTAGFAPAHAWLAVDRATRLGVNSQTEKNLLLHDLEVALQWEGLGAPMRSLYADLLVSEGRVSEALTVLANAANTTPRLWLKVAAVANSTNRTDDFTRAAQKIRERVDPRVNDKTADVADYTDMANLSLLEQKPDDAIRWSQRGLALATDDAVLKRTLSEAYRAKYISESDFANHSFRLELLDAALKADGSNPGVTQEIAKLIGLGQDVSSELDAALREKLTSGQATALTHVLLARRQIIDGRLEEAVGHLEIARQISPLSPIILNNLGVALARTAPDDKEKLTRAEQLLRTALRISRDDGKAELYDSLGEILLTEGKTLEAVESLEAALALDNTRLNTRRQLAIAYRKVGLIEIAEIQEAYVAAHSPNNPSDNTPGGKEEQAK